MNKMQEYLTKAARDLNVRIIVPFDIDLASGQILRGEALFPDLGFPKGIIVCQPSDKFLYLMRELKSLGYGLSLFYEPSSHEIYDMEVYKKMFIDWGWSGDLNKRPEWMVQK